MIDKNYRLATTNNFVICCWEPLYGRMHVTEPGILAHKPRSYTVMIDVGLLRTMNELCLGIDSNFIVMYTIFCAINLKKKQDYVNPKKCLIKCYNVPPIVVELTPPTSLMNKHRHLEDTKPSSYSMMSLYTKSNLFALVTVSIK